jgi:type VI secretion system secreted protein Hcp
MTLLLKGPFKGSSNIKGYEGWTPIDSLQWGAGRGISAGGTGAQREASRISVSEVTITKSMDQSTAALAKLLGEGGGVTMTIVALQTLGDGTPVPTLTLALGETLVSGFSTSSGGDRPSESYSFNFLKLNATMKGVDEKGVVSSIGSYSYNVAAGTVG